MTINKIALITGANAGIGLSLATRILDEDSSTHLILACRNKRRAEEAKQLLLEEHPKASVEIVLLDTSRLTSVYDAAESIRSRHSRLDDLFLNAGIMPVSTVDWKAFREGLFSSKVVQMFTTGDGLLKQVDSITEDGLQNIFATNLFGHFTLVRELQGLMGKYGSPTQIIWTSSSNAKKDAFNSNDFQHKNGREPYSSSKYASDMISVAMNEKLNSQGIYSHTTCPGLVMTNLTYGILPNWFWSLVFPFLWLLRFFTQTITITPYTAAEVLVWLFKQSPQHLDPLSKYHSQASITGARYVKPFKMNIHTESALRLYDELCDLEASYRLKLKS